MSAVFEEPQGLHTQRKNIRVNKFAPLQRQTDAQRISQRQVISIKNIAIRECKIRGTNSTPCCEERSFVVQQNILSLVFDILAKKNFPG